jgi:hypothetical protein
MRADDAELGGQKGMAGLEVVRGKWDMREVGRRCM